MCPMQKRINVSCMSTFYLEIITRNIGCMIVVLVVFIWRFTKLESTTIFIHIAGLENRQVRPVG